MRRKSIIVNLILSIPLLVTISRFSITLVQCSPLDSERGKTESTIIPSTTTVSLNIKPFSNATNFTATPVKAEIGRRTNTPDGSDGGSDDDDGPYLDDDGHPYGPLDDHLPLTPDMFFSDAGMHVNCISPRTVLSIRPHDNNPLLPASQWPNWRRHIGIAEQSAAILRYQDQCKTCKCMFNGKMVVNSAPYSLRGRNRNQCTEHITPEICATAAGCFCTADLVQPTDIPITVRDAEIQDTLDEIPLGVKLKHEDYKYRHGSGREFGFSEGGMGFDPRIGVRGGDGVHPAQSDFDWSAAGSYKWGRVRKLGISQAPPFRVSPEGNSQQLVPGTKEPYYLEGPDQSNWWRSNPQFDTTDALISEQFSKRDTQGEKPGSEVSAWNKGHALGKASKDQISPVKKDRSVSDSEKPTKTIKLPN
ncbi:hypothetical protein TWF281_010152 [Arthrobotrys megalospora]